MTQSTRLFRIFVSSTFADLTAERNILQQKTFPALREYCRKKGVEFQAIDLRWGVSEEASLDQQTMNICLGEIRRCQALTPRPNFLVLLGQRYGWVPPPPQIPAKDFEEMSHSWSIADCQLVETWYRRDDNAVPPAYVLLPRTGTENWPAIEQQLVSALGQGARSAGWPEQRLLPYCASATHQEIAAGALEVDTPAEKVLCIFRDLEIPAASKNEASVYCDLNTTAIEALRHDLTQALPDENILRVQAAWDAASQAPATTHLQAMADEVYERLRSQIDLELEAPASVVSDEASLGLPASEFLDDEGQQHLAFARKHLEHFVGRSEALVAVEQHLQQHDGQMLVVQGAGGSGKTAFLSRVLQGIHASHPDAHVMVRFIGTTPDSSGSQALLRSLCRELVRRNGENEAPIDVDYPALSKEFRKRVESFPHPLYLVLDALDQLPVGDPSRTLGWLPQELGASIRLIVSTRLDETEDLFRYRKTQMLALDGLLPSEGQELLEVWLSAAGRTLQPRQRADVLEQFSSSGSLPLYLRLAFEETRRWKSWEAPETLAVGIPALLRHNFFDRLASEQHHGRTLVSRTLAYLAASRHGLSESELHDLLSRDVEVYSQFLMGSHHIPADLVAISHAHARYLNQSSTMTEIDEQWQALRNDPIRLRQALEALFSYRAPSLPVVLLARLRADLESYLTTRSFDDTLLLAFYHRELSEVAAGDFLAGQSGLIHSNLANYFERQADPEALGMWWGAKRYLRELPHHLIQAEDWSRLAGDEATPGVLTDLRFIQSKCTAGLTHDLVGDFNHALDLIPGGQDDSTPSAVRLRHFSNFVSHHLGVLSEYPAETLSIAVNYADSGPVVTQAERLLDEGKIPHLRRNPRPPLIPLHPELVMVLEGHKGLIRCVTVTSDGKKIVSGEGLDNHTIRVWDVKTGECLQVLEGHKDDVTSVVITFDGNFIVSGSWDKTIRIWDLETGKFLRAIVCQDFDFSCVAVTPNDQKIVSGSVDNTIRVWDLQTGFCLQVLKGHEGSVQSVAITPNGQKIVSGSEDNTIRVWDLQTGTCLQTLVGHEGSVKSVAITPNGQKIVSGSEDNTIRVWEIQTGVCLQVLESQQRIVNSVAITPDGKRLFSGSYDKTIRVWDLETCELQRVLHSDKGSTNELHVMPIERKIVSGGGSNLLVWDVNLGEYQRVIHGHDNSVDVVVVTPDGQHIVSGSKQETTIRVWEVKTGKCQQILQGHKYNVSSVVVTPDCKYIVTGSRDTTIRVWDFETGECLRILHGHKYAVTSVILTPDGERIISGSLDTTIRLWDVSNTESLRVFEGHEDWVIGVSGTKYRNQILSWSIDKTIRVWNIVTGECVQIFGDPEESAARNVLSPDGKRIVFGSGAPNIRVWDIETGECLRVLEGHKNSVTSVVLIFDGHFIVSGSWDKTIRIWNYQKGQQLSMFLLSYHITSLAVSPQGDRIVAGTSDGQIHILKPMNITLCETPMLTEL